MLHVDMNLLACSGQKYAHYEIHYFRRDHKILRLIEFGDYK